MVEFPLSDQNGVLLKMDKHVRRRNQVDQRKQKFPVKLL